jgi:UDP-4-amino-4,6-dideoxy-N-acetyl-beta-L-altrosamine transaminase
MNINYGRHFITEEDEKAVLQALRGDFLTQGPFVEEFENAFAAYIGSKYAVAVTNGTAALHLAGLALKVKKGQRVIVPANTFVASANCILYCEGEVEFVDIDKQTLCIDLIKLEELLRSKPKGYFSGVIPVDFAGYPVNLEILKEIAVRHDLWILEDACHAPGAAFKTKAGKWSKSGSCDFADVAIFSFHPVKHIACGEGGMVTMNDPKIYEQVKKLRTHGITKNPTEMSHYEGSWYYEMQELGFNYRIPDILCALGNSQLKRAPEKLNRRKEIAQIYDSLLSGLNIKIPHRDSNVDHAFHLYVVEVENRGEVFEFLRKNKIFPQVHYKPVYDQPYYKNRYGEQCLEVTNKYYERCLSLPMYPELTNEQIKYIVSIISKAL